MRRGTTVPTDSPRRRQNDGVVEFLFENPRVELEITSVTMQEDDRASRSA